jgi:hypothetical protein
MRRIIAIILALGFIVSLMGLLIASNCDKNVEACLLEKEYLMPDFHWHTNTIKYVADHGVLPEKILASSVEEGAIKNVMHAPLYYYLGAGVFLISENIGISPIFGLHFFSIILMLITNIFFFLLVKSLFKHSKNRKQLIIIATSLFVFLPINLYVSLAIHNHSLFYLFMILSFYCYNNFLENKTVKNSIFLGLSLGFTVLSSLMGLPLMLALGFIVLINYKKLRENILLVLSLFIGTIVGSFTLIRNYLLFGSPVWGGIVDSLRTRSFSVIPHLIQSFFGGVYGGYDGIYFLVLISSLFIILISFIGMFYLKKRMHFMLLMSLFTSILSLHTLCNLVYLLQGVCFGDIIHGRYLLGIVPILSIFFSLGLVRVLKRRNELIYAILIVICLAYSFDFVYAFISQ